MDYSGLVAQYSRNEQLFSVLFELTYTCNLKCFFCYNDVQRQGTQLTKEDYLRVLKELEQLNVLNIILSGGEPTIHPDFFEIGAAAKELGFLVRIKTNGHALSRKKVARIKQEIDPIQVECSLHGADAKTHDRQTCSTGSFKKLMYSISLFKEFGINIHLNSPITAWNEHQIEEISSLADELKVTLSLSSEVTRKDNGDESPLTISPSAKAIQEVARIVRLRAGSTGLNISVPSTNKHQPDENEKQCSIGSSTLVIDPFGDVLPCVKWRTPVGNVHHNSIAEIWSQGGELEVVRKLSKAARQLTFRNKISGFCIAQAKAETGDPIRIYPTLNMQLPVNIKRSVA